MRRILILLVLPLLWVGCRGPSSAGLHLDTGASRPWFPVVLEIEGPPTSEDADPNPFTHYRLEVTFTQEDRVVRVPGFYAADGQAAETSAEKGNRWRALFVPDRPGSWSFEVSFRNGINIAIADDPAAGEVLPGDGLRGTFNIEPAIVRPAGSPVTDGRERGMLRYVGQRYLQFAASGEPFLKAGADSPENFLAYAEFDGTRSIRSPGGERPGEAPLSPLHHYRPHLPDFRPGDPVWAGDRGRGILGALNYLANQGMNSVYFLTMNVAGDGQDVWPWTEHTERFRFDCSKLDQWEAVFTHMDRLGIMLHVVLTETENESLFELEEEDAFFADRRKLYYRELVARFSHHNLLVWNLGEENGWDDREKESTGEAGRANSDRQRKAFARYIRELDPYDHPIVVHTLPGRYDEIYSSLVGDPFFEGPSLQMGKVEGTHEETLKWLARSGDAGRQWFVCLDEVGPANTGVMPDVDDPSHDGIRRWGLWGNLMAGGAGVEWYFGYQYPHNDLNCEDWRSREAMWRQTLYAIDFFQKHLPFTGLEPHDELTDRPDTWCLAKPGSTYALYLGAGGTRRVRLAQGEYKLQWYNPRQGGDLIGGITLSVPNERSIAITPPAAKDKDWVALIKRTPEQR